MVEKLLEIIEKSLEKCPWLERQSIDSLLDALASEVEEIRDAVKKKDLTKLEEEIGDLIYDAFLVGAVAQRDYGVDLERAIQRVVEKISHRKPWLFWDEKISLEEAERIWKERKSRG